ncbi:MAG: 50S ribosomal protein L11 methyltransferase [Chloroflexota bacterium]|nr:50S ribosomal protein L11 methyltransferase [Chloroflexota bacterium]MDE2895238.1 50S ribosomal protein L11 methyltransferase [Chloroflexota bacterium]
MVAAQVELAVAAWELAGVHNSSVEYLLDEPTEEPWPGHDNRTERAEVVGYLTVDQWNEIEPSLRESAAQLLGEQPTLVVAQLPDRDWRTAWHDHFEIVRIPGLRTIVVRPPHIPYTGKPDEIVIDLVPGLAFGTGQHQSTRLCLGLLAEQIQGGERVLDVGTGSGILAVAAAQLGAASVVATDIDTLAVDAARQTVRQNRLAQRIRVQEGSIPTDEQFDLVVANLTADLLQYLAEDLATALIPGGRLIVSGLIAPRQDEVATALTNRSLQLQTVRTEDEWRALLFGAAS